jgi:hypothetical protein
VALTVWLIIGMYTHFFAVLLAGSLLSVLFVAVWVRKQNVRPVIIAGAVVAVAALGLIPFILGSASASDVQEPQRFREITQLLYRQIGHPTMAVYPAVAGLALLAAVVLMATGWRLVENRPAWLGLVAAIALGLAVTIAANFAAKSFSAAKVSYSLWALPGLCITLGAAVATRPRALQWVALAAVALLVLCQLEGELQLSVNGDYFAHSPHRKIRQVILQGDVETTAIVHDEESPDYSFVYYPLTYSYPDLTQFVVNKKIDSPGRVLEPANGLQQPLRGFRRLLVVRCKQQSSEDLARQIRRGDEPLGTSEIVKKLENTGEWRESQDVLFVSFLSVEIVVLERIPTPSPER